MKRTSETSLLEQVESQDMQSWQQFLNVGKQAAIKPGKLDPEVAAAIRMAIWENPCLSQCLTIDIH